MTRNTTSVRPSVCHTARMRSRHHPDSFVSNLTLIRDVFSAPPVDAHPRRSPAPSVAAHSVSRVHRRSAPLLTHSGHCPPCTLHARAHACRTVHSRSLCVACASKHHTHCQRLSHTSRTHTLCGFLSVVSKPSPEGLRLLPSRTPRLSAARQARSPPLGSIAPRARDSPVAPSRRSRTPTLT